MATPEAPFGDEAFEDARLRWEAPREIARLTLELRELEQAYCARSRALRCERDEWQEIAHPAEFRDAFYVLGDHARRVYWKLYHAGVSPTFEGVAAKTDDELLAIRGIGPVGVGFIRQVLEEHGYARAG